MANIVVVGPHPDDPELGMGGTIARLASQGHAVLLVDATTGEPTPYGDPETRALEAAAAANILSRGAPHPIQRHALGLANRRVEANLDARHRMAAVYRAFAADVIFAPHPDDAHPDHRAVTRIAEDARFDAKLTRLDLPTPTGLAAIGPPRYPRWLFYYYATHLRAVPAPAFLIDVSGFADRKLESILAYKSQFELNPANRGIPAVIEAALTYFGSRAGVAHAEAFSGPEPLALTSLDSIAGLS